jgi:hypothetical protein
MDEIIKRLGLIKNLISLEESEMIPLQANKLESYNAQGLKSIIDLLKSRKYHLAVLAINDFISSNGTTNIVVNSAEIDALRYELHNLEKKFSELQTENIEIEKQIRDFNWKFQKILGPYIEKVFNLRLKVLKRESKKDKVSEKIYFDFQEEYESYHKIYEETEKADKRILSEDDKIKIKQLFRKASLLIHPDTVDDEFKEDAKNIFIDLKNAYDNNNIEKVDEILASIKSKNIFVQKSETIDEKQRLMLEIERLNTLVMSMEAMLEELKSTEAYIIMSNNANYEEYIKEKRIELLHEISSLEKES